MALNLRVTDIDHERFLKVPWVGGPETHEDVLTDHPDQLGIQLCSPFHGDYIGGKVSQKALNRLEAIGNQDPYKALAKARDEWIVQRDAAAKAGQLGVGVGTSFLGASISGKYDKAVATMQDTSKDSVSVRYADSLHQLKLNSQPLTTEARQVLREYGPEAFETMFGTHFVSGFVIGCESGYCISMQTDKRDERDEFSLIAEIHFLFWSVSVEAKLAEKVETSLKMKPTITSYDTLEAIFEQSGTNADLTADRFAESSMEIRQRIKSLEARVATAKAAGKLDHLILEIVVSPWAALKEWHEGCADWRANVLRK
ncbi:hypothetical protein F52700_6584 [Fusarium sp. NRRL 52700]|nr:hypothetical protein F52700_6584 [Fusarium sp. NRRL 52700]